MKQLNEKFEYRKATLEDASVIQSLILTSLKENDGLFLPLLPTDHNATVFYMLEIRPCILNSDPCYLAFHKDRPVGLSCCSTTINTSYDLQEKTALGVITAIHPQYRRQKLATLLREEMLNELKEKGIASVISDISISNEASISGCKKIISEKDLGFTELSIKYKCEI